MFKAIVLCALYNVGRQVEYQMRDASPCVWDS